MFLPWKVLSKLTPTFLGKIQLKIPVEFHPKHCWEYTSKYPRALRHIDEKPGHPICLHCQPYRQNLQRKH